MPLLPLPLVTYPQLMPSPPSSQSALAAFGVARAINAGQLTVANVFTSLALLALPKLYMCDFFVMGVSGGVAFLARGVAFWGPVHLPPLLAARLSTAHRAHNRCRHCPDTRHCCCAAATSLPLPPASGGVGVGASH
jgi:hypothetical protein